VSTVGVDGCGAPLFALSLTGLARTYRAMVLAEEGSPGRTVADTMRAHPAWVSGTHRPECALMTAVPGLLVKGGAEGVLAFALPDGRAAAFKVEDGGSRAVPALCVALLRGLGVYEETGDQARPVDIAALDAAGDVPVLGGGRVVGKIRVTLPW
jgi:L-asparaginase II